MCTSTHGVTNNVAGDGKKESVGTRPKIGDLGNERRSDTVENTIDDTDSTNDSVFTERRGSELSIYEGTSAFHSSPQVVTEAELTVSSGASTQRVNVSNQTDRSPERVETPTLAEDNVCEDRRQPSLALDDGK